MNFASFGPSHHIFVVTTMASPEFHMFTLKTIKTWVDCYVSVFIETAAKVLGNNLTQQWLASKWLCKVTGIDCSIRFFDFMDNSNSHCSHDSLVLYCNNYIVSELLAGKSIKGHLFFQETLESSCNFNFFLKESISLDLICWVDTRFSSYFWWLTILCTLWAHIQNWSQVYQICQTKTDKNHLH